MRSIFLVIVIVQLSLACQSGKDDRGQSSNNEVKYAKGFELTTDSIVVSEPWPGAKQPKIYPRRIEFQQVAITSTTHLHYLELLEVEDRIVGFSGTQYVYSNKIRELIKSGKIKDLGSDGNLNLELLIASQPDILIAFDMGSESTVLDKVAELGIPVYYNSDFLEQSALGRAEWIKFFGALFNKSKEADSIFNLIETNYLSLSELTRTIQNRPNVLSGVLYGDAWFLPGGQNWSAQFIEDAGGNYLWNDNEQSGWLELSFESVYQKANGADYWIGTSTFTSRSELVDQDDRYGTFEAYQSGNVYSYSKRIGPGGGFDIFESGYARPDIVLKDLIKILHPEIVPDHQFYYYQKLP
jgi:iron complex transport system substrate-binding protein